MDVGQCSCLIDIYGNETATCQPLDQLTTSEDVMLTTSEDVILTTSEDVMLTTSEDVMF